MQNFTSHSDVLISLWPDATLAALLAAVEVKQGADDFFSTRDDSDANKTHSRTDSTQAQVGTDFAPRRVNQGSQKDVRVLLMLTRNTASYVV